MKVYRLASVFLLLLLAASCMPGVRPEAPEAPKPRVALVLGAGASKGFAHVGVIKVLESNGIPVDMIVGTSAGSFVGALYAYGRDAFELQRVSFALEKDDIVDLSFPDRGIIKGEKLQRYINSHVNNAPIEAFKIPFYAVATDLATGWETVFGSGDAGAAVRASCSIPGIFKPAEMKGSLYVDGGVSSPVAVSAARRLGADIVIAVDISGDVDGSIPSSTAETILKVVNIMYSRLSVLELKKADVVISPNVGHIGSADFSRRHETVLEGERAAVEALPKIREAIDRFRSGNPAP